jgi:CheY-like chemotaxis protein
MAEFGPGDVRLVTGSAPGHRMPLVVEVDSLKPAAELGPSVPILVVDDNPQNLELARVVLCAEGYTVKTAVDAEDALRLLASFAPRLILVDIQLPGMDGLQLTRQLKADPAFSGIGIIAVTSYAMKGDDEKAFAAGCDGYVTKPIDIDTFPRIVAQHLHRQQEAHSRR